MSFKALPLGKISLALICAILALALPLLLIPSELCVVFAKHFSYYTLLLTFALAVSFLIRSVRASDTPRPVEVLHKHWKGILVLLLCACYTQWHIPDGFKVLYDEHTLSSTAKNLHTDKIVFTTTSQHLIGGGVYAEVGYTDKRPSLFPFILSIVHDATGYRPENVFYLNGALGLCLLALIYIVCQWLCAPAHSRSYGMLAVLMFTGLPLFTQNVNGGGYELLNLCLIVCLILCTSHYLKSPGTQGLDLLIIVSILLANARYESILYTLVPVAALLLKTYRSKSMELTWFSCLSPLLLIVPVSHLAIFSSNERFAQAAYEDFFSISHLPGNLVDALIYLMEPTGLYSNSVLISMLGIATAVCLLMAILRGSRHLVSVDTGIPAFLIVTSISLVLTGLALSHFWGAWTDCVASRFSLPLNLFFVLCVSVFFSNYCKQFPAHWLYLPTILYLLSQTTPHIKRLENDGINNTAKAYTWLLAWINDSENYKSSRRDCLFIYDSVTGTALYDTSCIATLVANTSPEKVWLCLERKLYQEVFFFEMLFINGEGYSPTSLSTPVNDRFELTPIDQHHLTPNLIIRVSTLSGVSPATEDNHTNPRFLPHELPAEATSDETYVNTLKNLPFLQYSFSGPGRE